MASVTVDPSGSGPRGRSARRGGLSRAASVNAVEGDLRGLYPEKSWNDLHLQIVYYGRFFCTARGCCGPFHEPKTKGQKRCEMCERLRQNGSHKPAQTKHN